MSEVFRPMLATDADISKLRYPLLASPKLDGIRAVVRDGVVYSRSNKPIPNKYVQELFGHLEHFDGELIVGNPCSKTVYRDTVSVVMAHDKPATDVSFYVFDHIESLAASYNRRREELIASYDKLDVFVHDQFQVNDLLELNIYENQCLEDGYEGLILRDPNAPYKCGRSTMKEGYLLKLKQFVDAEATVFGFEERQHNANEAKTNELGRTARSSHKAGKVGMDTLGAINVSFEGIEFSIGTGFTDAERAEVWSNRGKYLGKLAKFKYFPVGVKTAPRHPVFLGWRDRSDT